METDHPIKAIRKALGWNRQKLAAATGVDVSTVSRWERGKIAPNSSAKVILEKLARRAAARSPGPSEDERVTA
jgi:Predicted transcriptional regulator